MLKFSSIVYNCRVLGRCLSIMPVLSMVLEEGDVVELTSELGMPHLHEEELCNFELKEHSLHCGVGQNLLYGLSTI